MNSTLDYTFTLLWGPLTFGPFRWYSSACAMCPSELITHDNHLLRIFHFLSSDLL